MPTLTLLQLLTNAAKDAGVIAANHTLNSTEATDAKNKFNMMLGLWSAQELPVYAATLESFNLVAGTASYSIGTGATVDTPRPEKILKWFIRDSGGVDYTDTEIWGSERYLNEPSKTTQARPYGLWYNATYPNGTIYLYPTPNAIEALWLLSEKPLTEITVLTTSVTLPNEYLLALQTNLGGLLCSDYGRQVPPMLAALAESSLNVLKSKNLSLQVEKLEISGYPSGRISRRRNIYNIE